MPLGHHATTALNELKTSSGGVIVGSGEIAVTTVPVALPGGKRTGSFRASAIGAGVKDKFLWLKGDFLVFAVAAVAALITLPDVFRLFIFMNDFLMVAFSRCLKIYFRHKWG